MEKERKKKRDREIERGGGRREEEKERRREGEEEPLRKESNKAVGASRGKFFRLLSTAHQHLRTGRNQRDPEGSRRSQKALEGTKRNQL